MSLSVSSFFKSRLLIPMLVVVFSSALFTANNTVAATKTVVKSASTAVELQNRFRIDFMVDNMTLLIQRKFGSAPVVIVLPDGSKWYSSRHPKTVKWVDGISGDMIYIEKPMPGPWQLLGAVLPGSEIKKISQLKIEVEPFPQPLFKGERLKVHAKLIGDDQMITIPGLKYLVEWTTRFISTHNRDDDNYANGTIIAGKYQDNGEGLDERPDDGIFTGETNLEQPTGDYKLKVTARNNIFVRDFTMPFTLSKQPLNAKVMPSDPPASGEWYLQLSITDAVKLKETHFHFQMVGPGGFNLPVTVLDMTDTTMKVALPKVKEYGSYRIKGNAVSTTVGGREIYIDLHEMFFNYIRPPEPPPSAEELAAKAAAKAAIAEEKARQDAIFWIIVVNVSVLLLGIIVLIIWRKKQSLSKALAAAELRAAEEKSQSNDGKKDDLDDIDLSIPDDN